MGDRRIEVGRLEALDRAGQGGGRWRSRTGSRSARRAPSRAHHPPRTRRPAVRPPSPRPGRSRNPRSPARSAPGNGGPGRPGGCGRRARRTESAARPAARVSVRSGPSPTTTRSRSSAGERPDGEIDALVAEQPGRDEVELVVIGATADTGHVDRWVDDPAVTTPRPPDPPPDVLRVRHDDVGSAPRPAIPPPQTGRDRVERHLGRPAGSSNGRDRRRRPRRNASANGRRRHGAPAGVACARPGERRRVADDEPRAGTSSRLKWAMYAGSSGRNQGDAGTRPARPHARIRSGSIRSANRSRLEEGRVDRRLGEEPASSIATASAPPSWTK